MAHSHNSCSLVATDCGCDVTDDVTSDTLQTRAPPTDNVTDDVTSSENQDHLPTSVVITSLPDALFTDLHLKRTFESLFSRWDPDARFTYLSSFRRVLILYSSAAAAGWARVYHHETDVAGTLAKCYLLGQGVARQCDSGDIYSDDSGHLLPPPCDKQFIISPPASPPVGWRPVTEAQPVLNYDLLTAVTQLAPGESHELHRGDDATPSIVVHVAERTRRDSRRQLHDTEVVPLKITHTRCPSRS